MNRIRNGRLMKRLLAMLFAVAGWAAPAFGQADTETRVWTMVSARGRMATDSPWRWGTDSLVGTRDGARTLDLLSGQVTVTYDVNERANVGIGYAYGAAFPGGGTRREHRLVQQFRWRVDARSRVTLKTALEERFITGRDPILRASQQVRATLPLSERGRLAVVASNQVFVQLNPGAAAVRGLDNAAFLGVAQSLTPRQVVEVGYLNLYSRSGSNGPVRSHVMSVALTVSL